jgi:hypothetical protein
MYGTQNATGYISTGRPLYLPLLNTSRSPLSRTTNWPMAVLDDADRLMKEAEVLFEDKKTIMRSDYLVVAEDQMLW